MLKLCGDIEPNPGPTHATADYEAYKAKLIHHNNNIKLCLLNARNIIGKQIQFNNLVEDHGANCIFAVTET